MSTHSLVLHTLANYIFVIYICNLYLSGGLDHFMIGKSLSGSLKLAPHFFYFQPDRSITVLGALRYLSELMPTCYRFNHNILQTLSYAMDLLFRKERKNIICKLAIQHFYKSMFVFFLFFFACCSLSLMFSPQILSCFSQICFLNYAENFHYCYCTGSSRNSM